jgi:cytochrome c556
MVALAATRISPAYGLWCDDWRRTLAANHSQAVNVCAEGARQSSATTLAENGHLDERSLGMKIALGVMLCALLISGAVSAQNPSSEYQGWMKSNAATIADLNKNLTAKASGPVTANVLTLRENLAKVACYWQVRNISDGAKFSLEADYALAKVGQLATEGKFEEAAATIKTVQANCAGCHMAHREQTPNGSFRIK